ncbi:MAG: cell wall hydrolase [archaeon]
MQRGIIRTGIEAFLGAALLVAPMTADAATKRKPVETSTNKVYVVEGQVFNSKPEVIVIDGRKVVFSSETPVSIDKYVKQITPAKSTVPVSPTNPIKKSPAKGRQFQYQTSNPWKDRTDILLARTVFGEARGLLREGRVNESYSIAYVPVNRVESGIRYFGKTIKEAILKPYQFSCFNRNDPNRKVILNPMKYDPQTFKECLVIAKNVLGKIVSDPSSGATLYYNPKIVNTPAWANSPKVSPIKPDGKVREYAGWTSIHNFYDVKRPNRRT